MAFKFLKKRWQKISFYTTVSLLAIILVVGFLINIYWSPILSRKVKEAILNGTDSLYSVNFSSASLRVIEGKIMIDQIEISPNLEVYKRRKKQHLAPNSLYTVQIKRLIIDHVHPFKLYFNDKLDIAQLVISGPTVRVDYEQNRDQDTVLKNKKTPYQLISKLLKSAHVKSIVLEDVKFKYIDHSSHKPDVMEFSNLNFDATDFLLDSISQYDKSRFLYCTDLRAELNDYEGTTDDRRYKYKVNTLRLSTRSSQLNMEGLSFVPSKSVEQFFKTTASDCIALKLDSLQLNNFDFKIYSKYHKIYGANLKLSTGSVHIYDNPAPNDTTIDASETFPHVLLRKLKLDVRIDTLQIDKIGVFYTEYNKKSGEDGTVSFENTRGKFFNVTNNKAALLKNNMITAQVQTNFMSFGALGVEFGFNMTDKQAGFLYKGHMGEMDLRKINPVTMPLAMVKIASGKVKSLDFNMVADKTSSKGNLTLLYNELKVNLLKRDSVENQLKKMSIASLLANALVIRRNNPSDNETLRSYRGVYKRKKSSSIFTFMWRSILMGLKSSAGYDAATESTVKQKMSDFKQGSKDRKVKKALRLQRRAERRQRRADRQQQKEMEQQEQMMR